MKTFLHVLLGIILGIILLVIAVGGAVYGVISLPVGDVLGTFNLNIIPPDHVLFPQTILQIVQGAIDDVQNLNNLSIKQLSEKYGIPIPADIHGISLDPLLSATIGTLTSNPDAAITEVVNSVNLENILSLAGVPKENLTKYPIFNDNMQSNIQDTMNDITSVLDANSLTLRALEDNFGFTLGKMELLTQLQDLSISKFADAIKTVDIGTVLDVDSDKFIPNNNLKVYAKVDRYEEIDPTVLPLPQSSDWSTLYIADIVGGEQLKKELRFIQKAIPNTDPIEYEFVVDNSSHKEGFDYAANTTTYYRHIEFEPYDATKHANKDIYVDYVINSFVDDGKGVFIPKQIGKISAEELFIDDTTSLKDAIETGSITVTDSQIATLSGIKFINAENVKEGPIAYGYVGTANKDTKLEVGNTGYFKVHTGTADMAIQHLSGLTINGLSNPQDAIMSLRLGDILPLAEDNVLYSLANCPIGQIPDQIETLEIKSIMPDLKLSAYVKDANGGYVYIEEGNYYTIYNSKIHSSLQRYKIDSNYVVATATHLKADNTVQKYIYDETEHKFTAYNGEFNKGTTYYVATADVGNADSKLLQRIAHTNIKGISALMNTVVLGDIMEITEDNILYNFADCTIQDIPNRLDTLTIQDIIKNIHVGTYTPNINGTYVYIGDAESGYYTIFNPTNKEHEGKPRFDYANYSIASKADLADTSKQKYEKQSDDSFTKFDGPFDAAVTYYVEADSKILQRLAGTNVKGIGDLINTLVLGDVMDLHLDTYIPVTSLSPTDPDYYYFENGMYKRAIRKKESTGFEFVDKNGQLLANTVTIYQISKKGDSHPIIKRLAAIQVNNMGQAMTDVIDELYFTDLFEIIENDEIKTATTPTNAGYVVKESPIYKDSAFVYDPQGVYYQSAITYIPLDNALKDKLKTSTGNYKYEPIYVYDEHITTLPSVTVEQANHLALGKAVLAQITAQNIFVKTGDTYNFNIQQATIIAKEAGMEKYTKLYKRVAGSSSDSTYNIYHASDNLYVELVGGYVKYNPLNPAHDALNLALRLTDGYFPTPNGETATAYYDVADGTIKDGTDATAPITFIKTLELTTGKYYYNKITDYTSLSAIGGVSLGAIDIDEQYRYKAPEDGTPGDPTFSKKAVVDIKDVSNNSTKTIRGYLTTNINEVKKDDAWVSLYSDKAIEIIKERSATLLRSLAKSQETITNIDKILKTFELGDLIDIEPDSLLYELKGKTLTQLPNALPELFNTLTIGRLVETMHITSINPQVLSIVKDVTFPKFFGALGFDAASGQIVFDMSKLFEK